MKNLKIGVKLAIAFACMVLVIAAMATFSYLKLGNMRQQIDSLTNVSFAKAQASFATTNAIQNVIRSVFLIIAVEDKDFRGRQEQYIENERSKYRESLKQLELLEQTEKGKALIGKIKTALTALVAADNKALKLTMESRNQEASQVLATQSEPLILPLLNAVDEIAAYYKEDTGASYTQAQGAYRSAVLWLVGISALSILFAVGCATLIARSITRPLGGMLERIKAIARGDLTLRVSDGDLAAQESQSSRDELGETAHMFNVMTKNLRRIIATLSEVTGKVISFAEQLSGSVGQQAEFSGKLATSIEEISATMEEFSSTASQIADHSHDVVDIANRTLQDAKGGATGVETLVMKMSDISHDNETSLQEIVELGRKSKEITKIMDIIGNIANQTKLIAFNAALEAASAGDAGKRFGVVAVEIRHLADSVAESADQTEGKIREIMEAVNRLVIASEKGSKGIREGLDYSGQTMQMLCDLVDSASASSDVAKQISLSTQQQQIGSSQVVLALQDLQEGGRNVSASIQQINAIGKELVTMSGDLKGIMGRFSLDGAPDSQPAT